MFVDVGAEEDMIERKIIDRYTSRQQAQERAGELLAEFEILEWWQRNLRRKIRKEAKMVFAALAFYEAQLVAENLKEARRRDEVLEYASGISGVPVEHLR